MKTKKVKNTKNTHENIFSILEEKISQAEERSNTLPDLKVYIMEEYVIKEINEEIREFYNKELEKSKKDYNDVDFYEFSFEKALLNDTINFVKYMLTYKYNNGVNLSLVRNYKYKDVLNLENGKVTIVFISKPNKEKLEMIVEKLNNSELGEYFFFDEITASEKLSGRNVEREVYKLIEKHGKDKHLVLFAKGLASRSFSMPPLVNVIIGIKEPSRASLIQKIYRGMTPDKNNINKTCNVLMLNFDMKVALRVAYESFYKDLENQTEVINEIRKENEKVIGETQNFDEYISYFKPKIINLSNGEDFVEAEDFYKYIYEPCEIQKRIIENNLNPLFEHIFNNEEFINGLLKYSDYLKENKGKKLWKAKIDIKCTEKEKRNFLQNFSEYLYYTFKDAIEIYTLEEINSSNIYFMSSFLNVLVTQNEKIGKNTPQCAFVTEHKEFYDFIVNFYENFAKEYLIKSYKICNKVK